MYIICVATYLYFRIVTFYVNQKIRRENNTYRRLSEDPANIPPNCHVPYEQETRRENNIQRWLSEDPARICLPSVKLLFHDQRLSLYRDRSKNLAESREGRTCWRGETIQKVEGKLLIGRYLFADYSRTAHCLHSKDFTSGRTQPSISSGATEKQFSLRKNSQKITTTEKCMFFHFAVLCLILCMQIQEVGGTFITVYT
jgi:hypothetical protein